MHTGRINALVVCCGLQVRQYGVRQLARADNDELMNYLLQLVQALKYEDSYPSDLSVYDFCSAMSERVSVCQLSTGVSAFCCLSFLISRAVQDQQLANFFYWYVTVEREDKQHGNMYTKVLSEFLNRLATVSYLRLAHSPYSYLNSVPCFQSHSEWSADFSRQLKLCQNLVKIAEQSRINRNRVQQRVERMHQLLTGDMKK